MDSWASLFKYEREKCLRVELSWRPMEQQVDNDTSLETSLQEREAMQRLWPQLPKFGVFQLKLYIDGFKDF